MNKLSPFRLSNFDPMIKTYGIFFLVGLLFYLFSGEECQRQRSIFFCLLYLVLLIVGFPLLVYIIEFSQGFKSLVQKCILMLFISIIVNIYFILMRKYGRKVIPERFFVHVGLVPIIILFFVPVIQMYFEDFINAFLWAGVISLSMTMAQYARINSYFEQKNVKRYGNSFDIINKKKEGEIE